MKAFLLAFLFAASAHAQTVRPISIARAPWGTVTTLEFSEMRGLYRLWQDISFDLVRWHSLDLGPVEGWGTFRLELYSRFWSAGDVQRGCAFWGYHLSLVREEEEPVWVDYTQ